MTLGAPAFAVTGLVLGLAFIAFAMVGTRRARAAALDYSQLAFLENVAGRFPWTTVFTLGWASAIVITGLALARPSTTAKLAVHDAAVVLCIDTSGSMASTDVLPSRAEASRDAALAFIGGVPAGTRLGLVAFNTAAIPLGALTSDPAEAQDQLLRLPQPNGGTAIGDALATAADLLPPAGRRAIVLVTDGVNNHGRDPLETARALGSAGIAIFTVGIGTNGSGELIPGTGENAELDEDALREIAGSANGTYARVADAAALRTRLATLAATSVTERRRIDLAFPLAIAGATLAFVTAGVAAALGRFP